MIEGKNFRLFAEFYRRDLPCYKALEEELDLWEAYWLNDTSCHPHNISSTQKSIDFKSFSNINKVCLRILRTLPVTPCTWAQSFSSMRKLKAYIRSTMISERLNEIALMHVHQEIVPDIEKAIDLLVVTNRRLNFIWLVFNQYTEFALKLFLQVLFAFISVIYQD